MNNIQVIDIGDSVICDQCSKDWTKDTSNAKGGFLFGSYGVCPDCAPKMLKSIQGYGETNHIKDYQTNDETFKGACLRWRGGNNTIKIISEGSK